jgi:hypothetical protein
MADSFETSRYYKLMGVNQKKSLYEFPATECLELYNLDFDVQDSWQKRPGSTFAAYSGNQCSGPIYSVYEFVKLSGASYCITASDTALFLLNGGGYTLLSPNWFNSQPPDTLTFLDSVWMANGQLFAQWNGTTNISTYRQAGFPAAGGFSTLSFWTGPQAGSAWLVAGVPAGNIAGPSFSLVNLLVAYSLTRNDGYEGPLNLYATAKDLLTHVPIVGGFTQNAIPFTSGVDVLAPGTGGFVIGNFVIPTSEVPPPNGYGGMTNPPMPLFFAGFSSINIYLGLYNINTYGQALVNSNFGYGAVGISGNLLTNIPTTNSFFFFTSIPATSTAFTLTTTQLPSWSGFIFTNPRGPSGMLIDWFTTQTPKYIENFQNSLVAAGFSNNPSTVWFSNLGQPEFFDPQNSDEVRTNDGDRILAMKAFNDQLIVCKRNSFHKYLGSMTNNDISTLDLVDISLDYGCLSNRTMVAVKQKLFWLDKKGIVYYDGATFDIISTPIEQIFRRMNISAAIEYAVGIHHIYRNQIWFSFPIDGSTTNNITVVYDYLVNGWTFFDGFSPSSFGFVKQGLNKETVWRGDYSGLVHYFGESFFSDSNQGITSMVVTRFENVGGENQTTLWRRLFLDVAPSVGLTGTLNGNIFTNYSTATTTVQATFAFYQNQFQTRAEMGVQGKAIAAQISFFSASLPLLINGYAWANRPLRNV